jgi:hypothetical protein
MGLLSLGYSPSGRMSIQRQNMEIQTQQLVYSSINSILCKMEMKFTAMCDSGNKQPMYVLMDILLLPPCNKLRMDLILNKGQFDAYNQVLVYTSQGNM